MISLSRAEIEALIDLPEAAIAIEEAYRATSRGDVNLPPVGHITFPGNGGDCHIKYGHMKGDPNFVIKVATGFPQNVDHGLENGNGLLLVLSAETGEVKAMLHDEMILTDVRTGIGGAIASRLLSRAGSKHILVVGTGPQARRQIEAHVALLTGPLKFKVWGRNPQRLTKLVDEMESSFDLSGASDLAAAAGEADIIVTATGATKPYLKAAWIRPGTHITAVGADAPGKQELETTLVARADVLAVDLANQCLDHGEVSHAAANGEIAPDQV